MSMHVAVIGAGASGLVALRHLSASPEKFTAVGFERNQHVGGTWVYSDDPPADDCGKWLQSPLYKNLKTNLPKEIMVFPDFPFPKHLPSFMKHEDVRQYLDNYADHFNLRQLIKFETSVESVRPTNEGSAETRWRLTYRRIHSDIQENVITEIFDAVMVCNGHYSEPKIPTILGLKNFQGVQLHSKRYRDPAPFHGLRVLILGANASGQDISLEISTVAKEVILCHRELPSEHPLNSKLPDNVRHQVSGIKEILENSVVFGNGEEAEVDVLLFCTGYRYSLPFLSPECHVRVDNGKVTPLYKHVIHTEYPTLSLVGLIQKNCPFPQFHCQVKFVLAALDGSMKLPSNAQMNEELKQEEEKRIAQGIPAHQTHNMFYTQWSYNDELSSLAKFEPLPRVIQNIFDTVFLKRCASVTRYRRTNYEITGPDTFREIPL